MTRQPATSLQSNHSSHAPVPEPGELSRTPAYRPAHHSLGLGINIGALLNTGATSNKDAHNDLSAKKKLIYTVVYTKLLIPGDGDPIEDAVLVSEGKLIAWVGARSGLPARYVEKALRTYTVPYLMPGLWDVHVHFIGGSEEEDTWPAYLGMIADRQPAAGARLARGCWEALQWGYTSLRDVAGYGCEVAQAIEDGSIVGPNIYSSGAALSQLGGHGDVHVLGAGDALGNLGVTQVYPGHHGVKVFCICDGVAECQRGVRLQIRRGAKCIKVLASGGVMSSDDNPLYAQFSPEELKAIVEEATRMGRQVAAHVHGKAGILAAVNAGVSTVEHVSFADEECVKLIKEKGVIYVATSYILLLLLEMDGVGLPKKIWEKLKLVATSHQNAYKRAIQQGCIIALGTDTSPGDPNAAKEIEAAVKAGLSNLEALKAATVNAALTVRGQAPKTGQLKVGYEADFIGLLQNPVEDVKVLQVRDNIRWVWKGGKIYKGPGVGPWGEE